MDYLPIFAAVRDQPCLVVGGGDVAERKVRALLAAGARVTVNAPVLNAGLAVLQADGAVQWQSRGFDAALIESHLLILAATSDREVNHRVAAAARAARRLCNVVDDPEASSWISPSVIERGPLVIAVSSGGQAPVLARLIRQRLERWLPPRIAELARWAGGWRDAVKRRFPDVDSRRQFWERTLDGPTAEQVLAGRSADADVAMTMALNGGTAAAPRGEAYLIGAGPGDPELLTLRGFELLQHADVVLHDRLVAPEIIAFARRDAEIIEVGKTGRAPSTDQATINALLVARVRDGKRVCRLKGGDPFVFGRGGEEAEALRAAGLRFQVVPGITAATGAGAYAGIPLTHRGVANAVTLVTAEVAPGHEPPDWTALAGALTTLVIYMPGGRLASVGASLIDAGRAAVTPVALVSAGTTRRQTIVRGTLAELRDGALQAMPPAVLFVGATAALADSLGWFETDAADRADVGPAIMPPVPESARRIQ